MQYRITKPAQEALSRIYNVFFEFAGQRNADKMLDRVDERLEVLQKYPLSGHPEELLKDRKRDFRWVSINKNYRMIYYVEHDIIWIVDFWDRRENPAALQMRIR